jgi:hypothetical protein
MVALQRAPLPEAINPASLPTTRTVNPSAYPAQGGWRSLREVTHRAPRRAHFGHPWAGRPRLAAWCHGMTGSRLPAPTRMGAGGRGVVVTALPLRALMLAGRLARGGGLEGTDLLLFSGAARNRTHLSIRQYSFRTARNATNAGRSVDEDENVRQKSAVKVEATASKTRGN